MNVFSSIGWAMILVIVLAYFAFSPLVAFVLAVLFLALNMWEGHQKYKPKQVKRRY